MHSRLLPRLTGAALLCLSAVFGAGAPAVASASAITPVVSYSDLFFFGDSLSDSGNLYLATGGGAPPANQPYFSGRFSDGPVWTEDLAHMLGHSAAATPFLAGGNNYAFAGARTGGVVEKIPGLITEIDYWSNAHASADANALYVLLGGANDLRDARSQVGGDDVTRQAAAQAAIDNLALSLTSLAAKGAKNVLLATLPDLGATPEAHFLQALGGDPNAIANSHDATIRFNSLMGDLKTFAQGLGMNVTMLDLYGLTNQVLSSPAAFGVTNVSLPCAGFEGSAGDACSTSLYSDALHPSALSHQLIADAAYAALSASAVPEPQTYAMLLLGVGVLVLAVRRRKVSQNLPRLARLRQ